ncbi:MAG: hypothetical protein NC548_57835, partial [Lachnospiraceae bacterium]|nr:hypothetical protein [Lachnospiraceae bacterium]
MKTRILSACALSALALTAVAQNNYKVVVTGTDGKTTTYETTDVKNIQFKTEPAYNVADNLVGAEYSSDANGLGQYYICFGTGNSDNDGNPIEVGGMQVAMELTAPKSEDYINAVLPNGYYTRGTGTQINTFNVQKTGIWVRLSEGEDGVTVSPLVDGSVNVDFDGDIYDLKCEFTLLSGEFVALEYLGEIEFQPGVSETEYFTGDVDVTFEGAQGRYWANWFYPFADDAALEFYTGEFNEDGAQTKGYWFYTGINMPKLPMDQAANPSQYIADGVYTVDPREIIDFNTNLPYTLAVGRSV